MDKNVFENLNILKRVVGFSALSYFAPVSLTTAASEIGILNEFRFFSLCGFLNTVRIALVVAVFGLYGGGALFSAQRLERQEISPLLAHVERTSPETPVWIYWVAQAAMRVMAPPALTQIGLLDPRSHQDGWTRKAEVRSSLNQRRRPNPEYVKDMQKALEGYHDVWLLFSHLTGMEDSLQHFLDAAGEVVGPCSEVMATSGASTALFRCTRGHPSLM